MESETKSLVRNVIFLSKVAETVKAKLCVFCSRLSMHIVNGKIHYEERYATLLAGRAC